MTPQQSLSQPATRPWSRDGFSLVELSIVLVILGLLTGGILAGQDLIRSAELRAVTTEFNEYQTAVQTFRNKYMALPGDMDNAGDFWGYATNDPAGPCTDPHIDIGTDTQTCNGNGNGDIGDPDGGAENYEELRTWQHLANAGLINGSYTGVDTDNNPTSIEHIAGENAPESAFSNNLHWQMGTLGIKTGGIWAVFDGAYGHTLLFRAEGGGNVMTPGEAYTIDRKIDDGQPGRGDMVVGIDSASEKCTETSAGADDDVEHDELEAVYQLSYDEIACNIIFRNVF